MPKRFRFRLEPVLQWRHQKADQHQRLVTEQTARIHELLAQKQTLLGHRQGVFQQELTQEAFAFRNTHLAYLQSLSEQLSHLDQEILKQQGKLKQLMATQVRLNQDESVLEKLKEKAQDAYQTELLRQEEATLNELALTRYLRQGPSHLK
jgi:uncharacterized protein YjcR